MTEVYDLKRVVELVEKVIEERGSDYVYTDTQFHADNGPSCFNIMWDSSDSAESWNHEKGTNYRPGCIVGSAVIATDLVDVNWMVENDHVASDSWDLLGAIEVKRGVKFTEIAKSFLSVLQQHQDNGESWGDSLSKGFEQVLMRFTSHRTLNYLRFTEGETKFITDNWGEFRPKDDSAAVSS